MGDDRPARRQTALSASALELETHSRTVKIGLKQVVFPKKEFEVLSLLANHPGKTFSRKAILGAVWGNGVVVEIRTVDVHIRKIREKLSSAASLIETVKGIGYRCKEL